MSSIGEGERWKGGKGKGEGWKGERWLVAGRWLLVAGYWLLKVVLETIAGRGSALCHLFQLIPV